MYRNFQPTETKLVYMINDLRWSTEFVAASTSESRVLSWCVGDNVVIPAKYSLLIGWKRMESAFGYVSEYIPDKAFRFVVSDTKKAEN